MKPEKLSLDEPVGFAVDEVVGPAQKTSLLCIILDLSFHPSRLEETPVLIEKVLTGLRILISNCQIMNVCQQLLIFGLTSSGLVHTLFSGNAKSCDYTELTQKVWTALRDQGTQIINVQQALSKAILACQRDKTCLGHIFLTEIQKLPQAQSDEPDLFSPQYRRLMNCARLAYHSKIAIDVCSFHWPGETRVSPILHEVTQVSLDGRHFQVPTTISELDLASHLTYELLPLDPTLRQSFYRATEPLSQEDLHNYGRSHCLCHGKPLRLGYLCSRCLTIHCGLTAQCTGCAVGFA